MKIIPFVLLITLAGCGGSTPVAELYNTEASTPASLSFHPLEWKVISTFINTHDHTMSTLYGNDSAVQAARSNRPRGYPAGCELALVTWQRKEDPHWYGANLPGEVKCVERVIYTAVNNDAMPTGYERYEGNPLKKVVENDPDAVAGRIAYIGGQQASVMP